MKNPKSAIVLALRTAPVLALVGMFVLSSGSVTVLKAAPDSAEKHDAAKGPALPVTSKFTKVSGAENGPYVLTLKNDSKSELKVTAKILLAISFHAESKAKNLPEHAIAAGKDWAIPDLAMGDKVILTAHGFAPLELVVP